MRKFISTNALLIGGFVLIALGAFSFYAYGETRKACATIEACKEAAPAQTEMLWDAMSRQISSSSIH